MVRIKKGVTVPGTTGNTNVGVVSNGLRVVRLLPAVVWLGVVVTIGHFLVYPGYLSHRIFCMW